MATIGLIGSGLIGGTVARLVVTAGHDVLLSNSRPPGTLAALAGALGPRARTATPTEAATAGDVVVIAIPFKAYQTIPVAPLRGKTVVDTTNYYPERDGDMADLESETATTGELLQLHLPESHVVKAMNNIYYKHLGQLARPRGAVDRSTLPIAGNDPSAKKTVAGFLDALGYDTLDTGPLSEAWRFDRDTPAYAHPYTEPPVDAAALRATLDAAHRHPAR